MVGIVDVSAVAADPRAPAVGRVLDVYFSGINAKDFTRALSVFDPAGVLNPGNPDHVGKFAHDDGTSVVSAVVVHGISDDPTRAGAVTVSTTFQSTQASGYGPRGRETETCTRWTVAYTFTASTGGVYLILRGDSQSAAC